MKAIRVHQVGGPEVMQLEDIPVPTPADDEILIRQRAVGVNYIDTYQRTGAFKLPLPFTPGMEAAGVVEAVGAAVTDFKPGDRAAYTMTPGAYAEFAAVPAANAVPVPQDISFEQAAAVLLQGMTAHYLTTSTYPLKPGDTCLIHAAAGGTGLMVVQTAKKAGATVIGTTSTPEKAELARQAGADHIILYTQTDFEAETRRLTGGQGVQVVYDSVGQATFDKSLAVLRPRGMLVLFGQASGPVPPFDPMRLGWGAGSLFLTRPSLFHYVAERGDLLWRAGDVFNWLAAGELSLRIDRSLPLPDAPDAHRLLTGRKTAGKLLLIP